MAIRDHEVLIDEAKLTDLRARLRAARFPASLEPDGWADGAGLTFMRELIDYWRDGFDWRAQERRINRLPNRMAKVGDQEIHFVHQRGLGPAPFPLILTHGWPGSFMEFERLIPLLADPGAHGADPSDAFTVVAPSLPGYGFSSAPSRPGVGASAIAGMWRELMAELGYERFGAQGGDIGAGVSMWLAREFPESVIGIHLNYISAGFRPALGGAAPPLTEGEQAYLNRAAAWSDEEGAYARLHATKPQTLAFALSDSPLGLAAWIAEKFRAWSDNDGDLRSAISMDDLLTDISLYWFSGAIASSLGLYKEGRRAPFALAPSERIGPPLGMALFPRELPLPPRSWVERAFEVRRWTEMPAGGHFAALERPGLLAEEIRAFFRPLRPQFARAKGRAAQ